MVNRKPLVLNSGVISELVSADSIDVTSNLPAIAPSAIFDFKNGLNLDSRIQLSRNSGVGTRFNKLGVLESVPANVPRFEYGNGVSKGLLIEQSVTNKATYSQDFTNASYAKSNVVITANAVTSPRGLVDAQKMECNTTSLVPHSISKTTTHDTTTPYFVSVKLKKNELTRAQVQNFSSGNAKYCNFSIDLVNKTLGVLGSNSTVYFSRLTSLNDDWILFEAYFNFNVVTTSATTYIYLANNVGTVTFVGAIGDSIYVTDFHVGSEFSSYIYTTTSATTRPDELAIIPTTNIDFINLSEFSAVVEFTAQAVGTTTVSSFHDATVNNRIFIQGIAGVTTLKITTAGVEQCSLELGTLVTGTDYKIAFRVKANDVAASINGAASLTDTSVTIPTVTTINLGSDYANTNILNSTLAKVTFYAAALTNVNLEALSL